jgi:hypothetical protein
MTVFEIVLMVLALLGFVALDLLVLDWCARKWGMDP